MSSTVKVREGDRASRKQAVLTVLSVIVFLAVYFGGASLDPRQRSVAATFAAAVVLWTTEAVPLAVTALVSTVALVVTGGLASKDAFGAYGDQIILLFIGSFILAKSMEQNGLDRRIALWMLGRKWATYSGSATILAIGAVSCMISLFVSNTATTAMLLPIAVTMLKSVGKLQYGDPFAHGFLLMLTWGSSVAVGTIIGTPPNVVGVGLIREATGISINFVQWAMFGMPITVAMLALAWVLLSPRRKTDTIETHSIREAAASELSQLGPLKQVEWVTVAGFAVAIALWLIPGMIEYVQGSDSPTAKIWNQRVPEAVAALLGAAILFVVPVEGTRSGRAMDWRSATQIEWGTILLFAGGLALGKAAFDSGLAKLVGEFVASNLGTTDVWVLTAVTIGLGIVVSELASNTASATVVVPIAIALAQGAGVSPIAPAVGAVIGSNLGFMLPISTPPNAIVYSSGLVPAKVMLTRGLLFDLLGFAVAWSLLRLILPMLNLA